MSTDRGYNAGYGHWLFCGGIVATAVLQGGFYPGVFLTAAIFFASISAIGRTSAPQKAEIILWAFAGWYLLAAAINGGELSSVMQACLPGAVTAALCCARQLSGKERRDALRALISASAVLAGIGFLAFGNVLSIAGATTARRLQFPFQYANAAGSWYAAMSLLAQWDMEENKRSWPIVFLQSALFLTRSVGACGLYILAELGYIFYRRKEPEQWQSVLLTNGISVCFAAGFYLLSEPWGTASVSVLLTAAAIFLPKLLRLGRQFRLYFVPMIGVIAIVALMGGGRFTRSLATFAERLYQIGDGLQIVAAHPVFGVGAGNWAYMYPMFQSAEYTSTVVHSGPIQVAVDAGLPALLLLAAFFALAWREGKRPLPITLAALLLSTHSLFDFGLQFFPIAVLTGFLLLFRDDTQAVSASMPQKAVQKVALSVFSMLCAVLLLGIWQNKQVSAAVSRKDWSDVLEQYDAGGWLLRDSRSAKTAAANAAAKLEQWDRVLILTESDSELSMQQILLRAVALQMIRGEEAGGQYLLDELARRPYQVDFYEETAHLLRQWNAGTRLRERYNTLAERFNQSENILTRLQGDARVYIYKI